LKLANEFVLSCFESVVSPPMAGCTLKLLPTLTFRLPKIASDKTPAKTFVPALK
jgi:hypothetical protein